MANGRFFWVYLGDKPPIIMENKNITLLVGSGAVVDAWTPVINAIRQVTKKEIDTSYAANCFFAQLVYLARFYSHVDHPDCPKKLELLIDDINILKKVISENLKTAQQKGEIKARAEFEKIISEFIIKKRNKAVLISTNWDTVIDAEINRIVGKSIPVLHIHGDINSNIYLPTEITPEKYRQKDDEFDFGHKHINLRTLLENTDELIIYGLSLSPLDAELLQSLCDLGSTKKVYIIDPDHENIKKNLLAIMANPNIPIEGIKPSEILTA